MEETVTDALVRRAVEKITKPWCRFQKHPSRTKKPEKRAASLVRAAKKRKRKIQKKARRVSR